MIRKSRIIILPESEAVFSRLEVLLGAVLPLRDNATAKFAVRNSTNFATSPQRTVSAASASSREGETIWN